MKRLIRLLMKQTTPDIHIRFMGDGTAEVTKKKTDGTLDRSVIENTGDEQK